MIEIAFDRLAGAQVVLGGDFDRDVGVELLQVEAALVGEALQAVLLRQRVDTP